jgi:inhibitor of cysteine peptidase
MKRIDENWKEPELDLVVGEEFELSLSENPTSGYRWRLQGDAPLGLSLESDDFDAGQAAGAGGRRIWRFKATGEGLARLELTYARSWEKTGARSFIAPVRIVEGP